ncbi:MAG: ABC transporter permease [Actinobacteria bacterium]|nr:MAG: ABC transporter permease [Actinomycetota bacterium]
MGIWSRRRPCGRLPTGLIRGQPASSVRTRGRGRAVRTIRNVFRRKLRALLTISGIAIGVFALIVMGAMAEKITLLVDGGLKWTGDKVTVSASDNGMGGFSSEPLSVNKIEEIERVPGVARASANITMLLNKKQDAMTMGMPDMITGSDGRGERYESFKTRYSEGRDLDRRNSGEAVVGADLVRKLNAKVGDEIELRGEKFKVVGILEKTLTAPDSTVSLRLEDAQRLFHQDMPPIVRDSVKDVDKLSTGLTVYVKKGHDPEKVARGINGQVDGIKAVGPKAFKEQVGDSTKIFTSIIFGIALISLLVGGLSVANTMTMAVSERTREIGIRKAIGASRPAIVKQFLSESALIALVGGGAGLALGALFATLANAGNTGTPLFLLTLRLIFGSLGFALFLGVLSGLYPAWHAAGLNPVAALRHE